MTDSAVLPLETWPVSRKARHEPSWTPAVRVVSGPRINSAVRSWKRANPGRKLREIAAFVEVSERQLLTWRTEDRPEIGANRLLKLAAILGTPVDDLSEPE